MVYAAIWQDTYYTATTTSLTYTIESNNIAIFSGKAYAAPNGILKININKVCSDYLANDTDFTTGYATEAIKNFTLKSNGMTLETYQFLYCWDYDFVWRGQSATLSMPVCDVYGYGMYLPTTTVAASNVMNTFTTPAKADACVKYGLYYLNARGGWDAFAIRGAAKKTDNITSFQTDRAFDNTTMEFEASKYLSEIKTAYELHTHWLSDEESEKLAKNLFSSNKVYLHNLTDATIKPVLITDKSVTYQNYTTNGRKLASYTINVIESQSKLRR